MTVSKALVAMSLVGLWVLFLIDMGNADLGSVLVFGVALPGALFWWLAKSVEGRRSREAGRAAAQDILEWELLVREDPATPFYAPSAEGFCTVWLDRVEINARGAMTVVPMSRIAAVTLVLPDEITNTGRLVIQYEGRSVNSLAENEVAFHLYQELHFTRAAELIRERSSRALPLAQPAASDSPPSLVAGPSIVDQLAKLADLHERGYLSREDFEVQRDQLLRRPGPDTPPGLPAP